MAEFQDQTGQTFTVEIVGDNGSLAVTYDDVTGGISRDGATFFLG